MILLQRRWHWCFAFAALAWITSCYWWSARAAPAHISCPSLLASCLHFASAPSPRITLSVLWDLSSPSVAGLPSGYWPPRVGVERRTSAGGAEWSPFVRRRQRIDQRTRDRRTARLVARPRDHKLTAPALGIALDGDLGSWRQGRYVVPPAQLRGKAMAVVGAPGAGKTVTLLRLAYLAGVLGRKVCFVDCKGTDLVALVPIIGHAHGGNRVIPGAQEIRIEVGK